MTVAELLRRISSRELAEWQAFYLLEQEDAQRRPRTLGEALAELQRRS